MTLCGRELVGRSLPEDWRTQDAMAIVKTNAIVSARCELPRDHDGPMHEGRILAGENEGRLIAWPVEH